MNTTTLSADKLRDALKFAAPFTTRSPLPLTECVLITIAGGQMKIECTDIDSHAQITVPDIDGNVIRSPDTDD